MNRKKTTLVPKLVLTLSLIFFTSLAMFASGDKEQSKKGGPVNTPQEINDYIVHHVKDSHDFHLFSYFSNEEEHHVGFPLPVMLWGSEGFSGFLSSAFHHDDEGEVVVTKGSSNFVKIHGKIYELNEGATKVEFDAEHHPINASLPIDLSITKSVFGIFLFGLILFFMFRGLAKQYKKKQIPTGFARVLEPLVIYVRDEIAKPNIGHKYNKFMGFLMTVFFFIWFSNLMGLLPFGFNVTGQLAVTTSLALLTFIVYIASSNKHFWSHQLWMPGVPYLLRPILAVIELAGTLIIKPFSLAIRLFANITAGHIVVMSLIAIGMAMQKDLTIYGSTILSLVLSLFITLIELLVAFLQAYIFTMLSALFIGMAVEEAEHH